MEQAHHLLDLIHAYFPHESADIRTISPLKLAYLGDAVYEIIIRTLIMERTGGPVKNLHKRTSEFVNAGSQAKLILCLQDDLSEEEIRIYRHGRNAKTSSVAKHADIHDYRNATGLEALFGYLYLSGRLERAIELCKIGFQTDCEREEDGKSKSCNYSGGGSIRPDGGDCGSPKRGKGDGARSDGASGKEASDDRERTM